MFGNLSAYFSGIWGILYAPCSDFYNNFVICRERLSKRQYIQLLQRFLPVVADAWVNPLVASDACSDIDEIHRKFIGVHYILSGREFFGCCDAERLDCNV